MLSTFAEFAIILAIGAVVLLVALTLVTRGRSLQVTRVSGPYWEIRNQNDSGTVVISKFVNKSPNNVEWSHSSELHCETPPEESVEADLTLAPGERVTIALFSTGSLSLRAVPLKSLVRKFDLVVRGYE